jgi:N-acetylneuraminic acid mutarotase
LLGGLVPGDASIATVLRVDLRTGSSRVISRLPAAAHDAAATPLNGAIYLFGGSGAAGRLVQRFDPASNGISTVGHLPHALSDLSAVTIGGTMYVLGGYDGVRARQEVLATSDGQTFRTIAMLPEGLRYAAVSVSGRTILIAGGQTDHVGATRRVFAVDTAGGSVRIVAALPAPIAHATMFVDGVSAFVIGGRDAAGRPIPSVWRVRISDGSISASVPLAMPLADTTLLPTTLGGAILAGGAMGDGSSGGETSKELFFNVS